MSLTFQAPVLREIGGSVTMAEVTLDPPGTGEVLVRMVASGVCHSCLHAIDGSHGGMPTPLVLGDEGAGVVEGVGPEVAGVEVGDHVVVSWAPRCGRCRFCIVGRPVLCRGKRSRPGTLADGTTRLHLEDEPLHHFGPATCAPYAVVDASAAIPIRRDLPLEVAALIGCAVTTGVGAVVTTANARLGDSLAVFGCGGVGLSSVQGANLVGAHPIVAVDLVDARLELAMSLGATHAVRADDAAALGAIAPEGFDVTVLAVGATAAFEQAWEATGVGGKCVVVGRTPDGETVTFNPQTVHTGERHLLGSIYGSMRPAIDFPKLADLAAEGRLRLEEMVTERYRPDETDQAYAALAAGKLARGLIIF